MALSAFKMLRPVVDASHGHDIKDTMVSLVAFTMAVLGRAPVLASSTGWSKSCLSFRGFQTRRGQSSTSIRGGATF